MKHGEKGRLVVVSNRTPTLSEGGAKREKTPQAAGGLVSALYPALQEKGGLWFGWSGQTVPRQKHSPPRILRRGSIELVTVDLSEEEVNDFYTGFCNRSLWPLFHCFPTRMRLRREEYRTYRRVNRYFAAQLTPLLKEQDIVWIHDYQLIPLGTELRHLGWKGRLGFFLHIPFPPVDLLTIMPYATQLLGDLSVYDLLGFHTQRYRQNCVDAMCIELGGTFDGETYRNKQTSVRCGVYAIGTDPASFERWANSAHAGLLSKRLRQSVRGRRIVLGVDRLDYTKGITERLRAFERFLERFPTWQGRVSLMQISAPSRTRVPEYIAQKQEVDRLVGAINGRFSEEDWVPIRYLYRAYSQEDLAAFYREADVCLVTPLRDGMNLVAKEYIASQTASPGVLMLSRFCGAADDLREAVIVNPYDVDGMADTLHRALEMPIDERRERLHALAKRVHSVTAQTWCKSFLADLTLESLLVAENQRQKAASNT